MSYRASITYVAFIFLYSCIAGTEVDNDALFEKIDVQKAGINFANHLEYTEEFNVYTFRNFYNGAGVGLGDFDNDGLTDIFFCGNQVDNKLYLNKGDWAFEDITKSAGVASENVWTTGVSIVDINADGWLDIYVCKSGDSQGANRHNELFINNGRVIDDPLSTISFKERSVEYGLDDVGLSTHAAFFDYDLDGDLDCYLLNNSFRSIGNYDLRPDQRASRDTLGGNKLFRNSTHGEQSNAKGLVFEDVSESAGIYGSSIGFGLGVTFGDVNEDGWPDIYVSNDFFEKDYLYINNRDGTFSERVDDHITELSMGSMGADMADVNNDGHQDIFVTEMLPRSEQRQKTKSLFENWNKYEAGYNAGYHRQFARNVLQLNIGNGQFKELARYADVEATDWSWGALIFDMDNDGWKDLFVANGIYKDLLDQDYVNFYSNPQAVREILFDKEKGGLDKLVDMIPSEALPNFAFRNEQDLSFSDQSTPWGFEDKTFSNGSAYGDLDNDGDLDLVINNVNALPLIYKNNSPATQFNYLQITLIDTFSYNRSAIGASVEIHYNNQKQLAALNPARGFMSSVEPRIHFGLGKEQVIDSVVVRWPDLSQQVLENVQSNEHLTLEKERASSFIRNAALLKENTSPIFKRAEGFKPDFRHIENDYSDFDREPLLHQMHSNMGPACCTGDVNNDGLEDFYIGGAKGQAGRLFVRNKQNNGFVEMTVDILNNDEISEDTDCIFFDANGDGRQDIYIASGSSEYGPNNAQLVDRLYFNKGDLVFEKSTQVLPSFNFENSSAVASLDYDQDGDTDLVVSTSIRSYSYGVPSNTYLLDNDGLGRFTDVSSLKAKELANVGMVTDLGMGDMDGDGDEDIIIVGEWMGIRIFTNTDGAFASDLNTEVKGLKGLWNTIEISDLDDDGDMDMIVGNHGLNSRLRGTQEYPMRMYVNDFDRNGRLEQITTYSNPDGEYLYAQRSDLLKQLPYLNKKYPDYQSYAEQEVTDIFEKEQLDGSITHTVDELRSVILWNNGDSTYDTTPLPELAQLSQVYAVHTSDFNNDGMVDIIIGGNQSKMKPETGINMGSYGLVLLGEGNRTFTPMSELESGIIEQGEIRKIKSLDMPSHSLILIAKNNDYPVIYKTSNIDE